MRPLYRKSIKDITQRKLRAVLTILGIAVGVLGLTGINISQGQINNAIRYSEDATGLPDITFYTSPTTAQIGPMLLAHPAAKAVESATVVYTQWKVPSGHKPLEIVGFFDLQHHQMDRFELTSGTWPRPGQILMESSNSGLSPVHVGDRITVQVAGRPHTLLVSGLVRSRGRPASSFLASGLAYARLADVQRIFRTPGVNYFMIHLENYNARDAAARQLQEVFRSQHIPILQVTVGHDQTLRTISNGILQVMQLLSIVALLLSIFLLLSTISTLISEQVRIMGTMKAIGATRGAVMRSYLAGVAIYSLIGTVLGFALGVGAAQLLMKFMTSMFTLDTGAFTIGITPVILAVVVGIGVPLLAAVIPIAVATRLTVRDALIGYGLDTGGHEGRASRALARLLTFLPGVLRLGPRTAMHRSTRALLNFVPGTMQLGIRGLFRKRTRTVLTLLALSVSAVAFLAVQTTSYSFSSWLNHLMDTYQSSVMINFIQPQPSATVWPIAEHTPGVNLVEPDAFAEVSTSWGNGQVLGLDSNARLYRKQVVAGRWFTDADRNVVVISTQSRDQSHLGVGDMLTVHDKLHTAHWRIIGVAIDNNGITARFGQMMVPINQLNHFRELPYGSTDGLMIGSSSSSTAAVSALSNRLDQAFSAQGVQATVMTRTEIENRVKGQVNVLNVMLYAVAVIVALVGAISLFNTVAMSVMERRREIGILRSMGATGRKVAGVFWTEALSLGLLAWVAGIVLGIPAAFGFVTVIGRLIMPVPFDFNPLGVLYMLVFIVVIGTLATFIPVWGAARTRIAQTLRYEG